MTSYRLPGSANRAPRRSPAHVTTVVLPELEHWSGADDAHSILVADVMDLARTRSEAAQLAAIVESSQDAIIGKSLDGIIRSWNAAAERMYGYPAAEAIGRPIEIIVPPESVGELRARMRRVAAGERAEPFETVRVARDGRVVHVLLALSPIRDRTGTVTGISAIGHDMTEHVLMREAMRRSEHELADFFENATMAMHWVGPDGTIHRANRAELDLLGYASEEYIGHNIADFHVDVPVIADILRRLAAGEVVRDCEARMRCRDGSIKHVLIESNVCWDVGRFVHTRCCMRDITEYRKVQRALREREETHQLALEAGRMGAWEWRITSGAVQWSSQLEAIHGLSPGTFGGSFEEFARDIHPDDRERVLACIRRTLEANVPYQVEYRIVLPGGNVRWVEARGRLTLDPCGVPERVIGVCLDVTDRKRREEDEREGIRRKDQFLAMLGHELRNPLGPIRNCLDIVRESAATPEQIERSWATVDRQVRHIERLVDDVLNLSRISSGKFFIRPEPLDVVELVRGVIDDHRAAFEAGGLPLPTVRHEGSAWVDGDATRLSQALGNVIDNAVKFTDRGGSVVVAVERAGDRVQITVRDTGVGMAPELLARIFEPFSQSDGDLDRNRGGLGLGLALAKGIVELHSGTIVASSAGPSRGSTFIVRLPAWVQAAAKSRR